MAASNSPRPQRRRGLPLKGGATAFRRLLRERRTRVRRGRTKRLEALLLTLALLAYGASPIDLIPDPIPLFGWLDDLVVLPLGFWLVVRLLRRAEQERHEARRIEAGETAAPSRAEVEERRHERLRTVVLILLGTALGLAAGLLVQQLLPGASPGG